MQGWPHCRSVARALPWTLVMQYEARRYKVRSTVSFRRSWGTVGVESRWKVTSSNKQQRVRLWEMCTLHPASGSSPPPAFGRESQCVLALGVMVVLLTIVKMEHPSRMSSCLLIDPRPPVCWNRTRMCWLVQSMLQQQTDSHQLSLGRWRHEAGYEMCDTRTCEAVVLSQIQGTGRMCRALPISI